MNSPLQIVTIIQTRRGSSRLNDKVLLPLMGKPLFVRQVYRVLAAELTGTVVIATTHQPADDFIENICFLEGFECYRGSEHDLLDRHYKAAFKYRADVVIKIPSDCPLIDPDIIDHVIRCYTNSEGEYDYVSNLHPATYPDGNDVEVMSFAALETAWKNAGKDFEREHTTAYIWERPHQFKTGNVLLDEETDYSMTHRWTIDYPEDYEFIKKVYEELFPSKPFFTYTDVLLLLEERPDIFSINQHLAGVNWYRHHIHQLNTITASETKQYLTANE